MVIMKRNKTAFYYLLYLGKESLKDENNYEIGTRAVYGEPVPMTANISAATGYAQTEQFGSFINYDRVIVTDDMECPIDENSVLFIDKAPSFDTNGNPQYDYIVKRVAKSLNSVSIAVSKVEVT